MREEETFTDKVLKGIGVSSGITSGRVYLLERGRVSFAKRKIREENFDKEIVKFKHAINSAIDELNTIKGAVTDDEIRKHAFIIDAHMLILQDTLFHDEVIDTIRAEKINAEWALDIVVSRFLSGFEKVDDPYLRERGQDIKYIYNRLIRIMIKGKESSLEMQGIRGKVIIVAGGIGIAGVHALTQKLGKRATIFFGCNNIAELPLLGNAANLNPYVSTLDGSYGFRGNVVQLLAKHMEVMKNENVEVFACGPENMLKNLKKLLKKKRGALPGVI